jgi:hypothetical protein
VRIFIIPGLDDRGSRVRLPAGAGNFSLHHRVQIGSGATQPPIQGVPGAPSLGVKRPGREVDHSPPSSTEVKECVELYIHYPNTPSWRGGQLKNQHRGNFTFTFTILVLALILFKVIYSDIYSVMCCFPGHF